MKKRQPTFKLQASTNNLIRLTCLDDFSIWLIQYRTEFSCLYLLQGHNFISTVWLWRTDKYVYFWFWAMSIFNISTYNHHFVLSSSAYVLHYSINSYNLTPGPLEIKQTFYISMDLYRSITAVCLCVGVRGERRGLIVSLCLCLTSCPSVIPDNSINAALCSLSSN